MKTTTFAPFDAAAYLDSEEAIAEYVSAAAEDPNPDVLLAAIGDVAKARRHTLGENLSAIASEH